MNKSEFIKAIAEKSGATIKDSEKSLNMFIEVLSETLGNGNDVSIPGFGSFVVSDRAARKARDFRTGETVEIPASRCVKFKAGKTLKSVVQ